MKLFTRLGSFSVNRNNFHNLLRIRFKIILDVNFEVENHPVLELSEMFELFR